MGDREAEELDGALYHVETNEAVSVVGAFDALVLIVGDAGVVVLALAMGDIKYRDIASAAIASGS